MCRCLRARAPYFFPLRFSAQQHGKQSIPRVCNSLLVAPPLWLCLCERATAEQSLSRELPKWTRAGESSASCYGLEHANRREKDSEFNLLSVCARATAAAARLGELFCRRAANGDDQTAHSRFHSCRVDVVQLQANHADERERASKRKRDNNNFH